MNQDRYHGTRQAMTKNDQKEAEEDAIMYWPNIPNAELILLGIDLLDTLKSQQLKKILAQNRSGNRICNRWDIDCQNGTRHSLIRCQKCGLTFWCSVKCQTNDNQHDKWCLKQDKIDNGPLRTILIPLSEVQ